MSRIYLHRLDGPDVEIGGTDLVRGTNGIALPRYEKVLP